MKFYQQQQFIIDIIEIIKNSNKIVMEIYKKDFEIEFKDDKSPLTIADKKCNDYICKKLKNINNNIKMDILIISEENKNIDYKYRKKYQWVWLVDPIDGTKEFIKKNDQFTINIGLCYNGNPIFGIVSIPAKNKIYYGVEGIGSYTINGEFIKKKHQKILVKKLNKKKPFIVASLSHINQETQKFIDNYPEKTIIRLGSSIKLLHIAEGLADIYPRLGPTMEWDTCAAHAVIKYANGIVYNPDTQEELVYNKQNLLNPHFICCSVVCN